MANKTKFGISATLYAALTFAVGLLAVISPAIGVIAVAIIAGAALLLEESDWLKRMVAKAFLFVVIIVSAQIALDAVGYVFGIFRNFLSMVKVINISFLSDIELFFGIISYAIDIVAVIFLLIYTFQAAAGKYASVLFVDGIVDKNM